MVGTTRPRVSFFMNKFRARLRFRACLLALSKARPSAAAAFLSGREILMEVRTSTVFRLRILTPFGIQHDPSQTSKSGNGDLQCSGVRVGRRLEVKLRADSQTLVDFRN